MVGFLEIVGRTEWWQQCGAFSSPLPSILCVLTSLAQYPASPVEPGSFVSSAGMAVCSAPHRPSRRLDRERAYLARTSSVVHGHGFKYISWSSMRMAIWKEKLEVW